MHVHVTLHARGNMNLDEDVWYVGGLPSAHDLKELGKSTTLPVALCNIQRDDCGLFYNCRGRILSGGGGSV